MGRDAVSEPSGYTAAAPRTDVPEIGVGLLGYAFMGKAHSNALKTLAYMIDPPPARPRLVAVAGRSEPAVAAAATRYGWDGYYTDWHDLVADPRVQLFDNAGPNDLHLEPCLAAIAAGKHVLCEKPLGRTAAEAKQLVDAARGTRTKHMLAHNYRFVPALRLAYEMIHTGELGEIRHLRAVYLQDWLSAPDAPWSWRMSRASAGAGALGDIGTHIIDLARFLIGEVTSVAGSLRTFTRERPRREGGTGLVDVDDAATAVVEFANGAVGTLEASRVALGRRNHLVLEVNGSRSSLRFNLERLNELDVYDPGVGGFANVLVTQSDHPFMRHWWPPGHIIGWEHTFVHELAHLLEAIAHDRPVAPYGATFEDGYRTLLVAEALARSADEGIRVKIPA